MKANNFYCEPLTAEEINLHHLTDDEAPAVYVGTYAKYNDGDLTGDWIDLTTFADADELREYCERMHADEADPELMVQDFMNFPSRFYSESYDSDLFSDLFEFLEMDDDDREACSEYWDEVWSEAEPSKILDSLVYRGDFSDFAEEQADEMMACSGNRDNILASYFDYKAWERDLSFDYHITNNFVFSAY